MRLRISLRTFTQRRLRDPCLSVSLKRRLVFSIAFLTRSQIEKVEIPELQRLYNATAQCATGAIDISCCRDPASINPANCTRIASGAEIDEKLDTLQSGIDDWVSYLEAHDNIAEVRQNVL